MVWRGVAWRGVNILPQEKLYHKTASALNLAEQEQLCHVERAGLAAHNDTPIFMLANQKQSHLTIRAGSRLGVRNDAFGRISFIAR